MKAITGTVRAGANKAAELPHYAMLQTLTEGRRHFLP